MDPFHRSDPSEQTDSVESGEIDSVSRDIIRLLCEDGRKSTADLARELGVAEGTVRRKLRRLLESRTIAIKAVVDPLCLGQSISATIGLDVERRYLDPVADRLASYAFVDKVYLTTGPFDVMIEVTMNSVAHLYSFLLDELASVEGITDTETYLIGRVYKRHGLLRDRRGPTASADMIETIKDRSEGTSS
jgi:Lrp/AsnC family transcriptional regulator for asnA, asnC and gidA